MRGNIFICLNESTYNGEIPEILQGRYARKESDEDGNFIALLPTTFKDVGEDNKQKFGAVVSFQINGASFYILELSGSWVEGEVSALSALGEGLQFPSNSLLTDEEARLLIKENTDDIPR